MSLCRQFYQEHPEDKFPHMSEHLLGYETKVVL